jgi:hypothetical protein
MLQIMESRMSLISRSTISKDSEIKCIGAGSYGTV